MRKCPLLPKIDKGSLLGGKVWCPAKIATLCDGKAKSLKRCNIFMAFWEQQETECQACKDHPNA